VLSIDSSFRELLGIVGQFSRDLETTKFTARCTKVLSRPLNSDGPWEVIWTPGSPANSKFPEIDGTFSFTIADVVFYEHDHMGSVSLWTAKDDCLCDFIPPTSPAFIDLNGATMAA
jgi:hypothetical protein